MQLFQSQRGIMRQVAQDTRRRARGRPVFYTEWNSSSNPRDQLHDQSYAAAFAVSTVMEARGLVEGYSFWTFSDIFEENHFPSIPFHGGFGLLNLHGIPKPTYRGFQILHDLGTEMLVVDGLHETVDCWVIRKNSTLTVLLTNHTTPGHSIEPERVEVRLENAPEPREAHIQRIDAEHANPEVVWQEMGQPEYLAQKDIEQLLQASRLVSRRQALTYEAGKIEFTVELPEHSVAAVTIQLTVRDNNEGSL